MKSYRTPIDQLLRFWPYLILTIFLFGGVGCAAGNSPGTKNTEPTFLVIPNSTRKICQLTGEYDYQAAAKYGVAPQERPTLNQTYKNYGFHGTDLGISFEHNAKLWFLFGDTFATETIPGDPVDGQSHSDPNPIASDATAYTTDTDPTDCISLQFLMAPEHSNVWRNPSFDPGGAVVQEEGFSTGDSIYVWYSMGGSEAVSTLARSDNDGESYTILHDVSDNRFIGINVVFVPNLEIPGLEIAGKSDWLFVFGTGPKYRESDMYLAVIPLALIEEPDALVYFTGRDQNGLPQWSVVEDEARPIIDVENPLATGNWFAGVMLKEKANAEGCIGEFSVHYSGVAETWIAMYNCDFLSIEMHTAVLPWGPWSQAVTVFDPLEDGGYCGFLHLSDDFRKVANLNCDYNVAIPGRVSPGSPYGPYIMERYTTGDRNQATLYFVMSMWHPYNVLVMETQIQRR